MCITSKLKWNLHVVKCSLLIKFVYFVIRNGISLEMGLSEKEIHWTSKTFRSRPKLRLWLQDRRTACAGSETIQETLSYSLKLSLTPLHPPSGQQLRFSESSGAQTAGAVYIIRRESAFEPFSPITPIFIGLGRWQFLRHIFSQVPQSK